MNDANPKTKVNCHDRERIFEDGSRDQWTALEAHALTCTECAEEIRAWKSLSVAARELRDRSDDTSLWPRIHRSLIEEAAKIEQRKSRWTWESIRQSFAVSWQTAAAAAVVLVLVVSAAVYHDHNLTATR